MSDKEREREEEEKGEQLVYMYQSKPYRITLSSYYPNQDFLMCNRGMIHDQHMRLSGHNLLLEPKKQSSIGDSHTCSLCH